MVLMYLAGKLFNLKLFIVHNNYYLINISKKLRMWKNLVMSLSILFYLFRYLHWTQGKIFFGTFMKLIMVQIRALIDIFS